VTVVDTTKPVVTLNGDAEITLECGLQVYTEPGATALDACDGSISVAISGTVDTSATGDYTITYSATDGEDHEGTATRTVSVVDTTSPEFTAEPADATILTDAGYCFGTHEFAATATDNCTTDPAVQFFIDEIEITSPHRFELGSTLVDYTAEDPSGNSVSGTFLVTVEDPYQNCAFNVAWPAALEPQFQQGEGFSSFSTQQLLGLTDQSRWYKFNVLPGSRVTIILSEVPANYDIVVYRDIQAEFERLLALFNSTDPEEQELSLLGAEFAPESFTPESFIAESFSPENYSPESFIPESFIPESFIPESFIPESFIPESFIPESFIPESFIADSYSPESFIPESFIPESFIPESFIPESFIPESFIGENFTPESFIAAQLSSMIAYSAFPGVVSEGVSINTYTLEGDFYVRVRGANGVYDGENPFTISVFIEEDICGDPDGEGPLTGVQGPESFPDVDPVGEPGNYQTVILWDSARTPGTVEELEALEAKLEEFAPEVAGAVIDLALEDRVLAANIQADDFPTCPYAKNLVAEETKAVIDAWRSANSTTLQYVLLLGNDEAIPFFRTTDEAFLANESNYVPPVQNNNHSQSSLRYGQILTQDPYGSDCIINLSTGPYPYADLAVGRLVESAADMTAQMDNYLALTGGILAGPSSALVTGYDFLDDLANAIEFELETALGSQIDTLIDAATTAPADGWSASELADIFLGVRHDIVFLAGHFSTGSSLAADYQTRLTASQVLQSGADLLNTLIFSVGCHSGYNTVDEHAINGFTKQPDWAQAFGQMGATFIAGTGYQYGDTEFIEYSERLYLEVVRQLRTGTGPVSIGDALVQAKRKYLAETPLMRGIHEKSLLQATLFGFPMLKIDVPGARIGSGGGVTNLGMAPGLVINNPGKVLGLATQDVTLPNTVQPLVEKSLTLTIPNDPTTPDDDEPIVAYWFEGNNGIVSNPAEPVRPLDSYNVSAAGNLLRGVGFRGGSYDDIDGFLPLTGAPTTEIRGVFGNFVSDVYYPVQPYSTNYFGTICGGTDGERLNVYRTQFYGPDDGVLGGTMRKYQSMDFRLFYNNNRETYYNIYGHAIIPALTAPPTISRVVSSTDGTVVDFDVTVLTSPAVGIQEVWVTYTGIPGSSLHGTWQSEDLTQGALPDTMIWSGSLPLPVGVQSDELRFMVQAASGIGLVTLKTNYGQYYEVGVDDLAARIETEIAFIDPVPAASSYGESVTVKAVLTAPGEGPLANKRVGFRIGASRVTGLTNGLGELTLELPVTVRPATDLLQAYFLGDTDYAPSAISQQFVISKQNTFLSWDEGIPGPPTKIFGNEVVVSLRDALGTPLKERTVFFLVDYGTFELGNSVITDIAGRADLSELFLPAGSATITAYYNGEITLPGGEVVNIDDVRYNPAFTSPSLDVIFAQPIQEDSLGFDPQQVDVYYKSSGNGRNTPAPIYENASISGDVAFNVPLQPADLLANDPDPDFIEAAVEVRLAGQLIAFDDEILLDTRGDNGNHWTTASRPGKEVSYVGIHWSNAPRFDTALSGSAGPRIYTLFIGNSFTEFRYEPAGMKEVVTDFPGGISIIVNKDGEVDPSSPGLISGSYAIDAEGITFDARIGLEPGMELVTRDNSKGPNPFPDIVVPVVDGVLVPETPEAPINYLTEGGRMIIRLAAMEATPRPGSDATPNLFECRFRLGNTGPGEGGEEQFQVRSIARIGEGLYAIPWSSEDPGHKQYRP
jgi:hypothetical protein